MKGKYWHITGVFTLKYSTWIFFYFLLWHKCHVTFVVICTEKHRRDRGNRIYFPVYLCFPSCYVKIRLMKISFCIVKFHVSIFVYWRNAFAINSLHDSHVSLINCSKLLLDYSVHVSSSIMLRLLFTRFLFEKAKMSLGEVRWYWNITFVLLYVMESLTLIIGYPVF